MVVGDCLLVAFCNLASQVIVYIQAGDAQSDQGMSGLSKKVIVVYASNAPCSWPKTTLAFFSDASKFED